MCHAAAVLTALLCAAQLHVQASSIRAVLSAGGLRNERRFPETWNAGALGCDEVMGSGFTVAMKAWVLAITRINYSSTPELSSKGTTVGSLDSWHHRKCNCDNILAKCTNS